MGKVYGVGNLSNRVKLVGETRRYAFITNGALAAHDGQARLVNRLGTHQLVVRARRQPKLSGNCVSPL